MIRMQWLSRCLAGLLLGSLPLTWAFAQTADKTYQIPGGVRISVPQEWSVANEAQLRAYEKARDASLSKAGVAVPLEGRQAQVPFQATSGVGAGPQTVMMTVLPPELSQQELAELSAAQIRKLGTLLAGAARKGIESFGGSEFEAEAASLVPLAGKQAVFYSLRFLGPNGLRYRAEKYHVYTDSRTVILTTQVGLDRADAFASQRQKILEGLQID